MGTFIDTSVAMWSTTLMSVTLKHQAGSVYDKDGISPTLDTMQGGYRQPCVEVDKWNDLD